MSSKRELVAEGHSIPALRVLLFFDGCVGRSYCTEMFVTLTPHPTRLSAIAAVAITANTIFFFIIMEQDTPSIAVRLRWGGMRFLEKTKIQRFLLTSFQYLDDLYPCSRMANNLNFGNCY